MTSNKVDTVVLGLITSDSETTKVIVGEGVYYFPRKLLATILRGEVSQITDVTVEEFQQIIFCRLSEVTDNIYKFIANNVNLDALCPELSLYYNSCLENYHNYLCKKESNIISLCSLLRMLFIDTVNNKTGDYRANYYGIQIEICYRASYTQISLCHITCWEGYTIMLHSNCDDNKRLQLIKIINNIVKEYKTYDPNYRYNEIIINSLPRQIVDTLYTTILPTELDSESIQFLQQRVIK